MEKKTCLYDKHVALGALMQPFGGFIMPIQYTNITDEHNAVRQHSGVFDVSHMGEVTVKGPDAERYVNHIFTGDVKGAEPGKIFYGMMCYENGGTVDDLLVYKMAENDFFLVINAANIDKDVEWMKSHLEGYDVEFANRSDYYGQLAVQGPEAEAVVEEVLGLLARTSCSIHQRLSTLMARLSSSAVPAILEKTDSRFTLLTTSSSSSGTSLLSQDAASLAVSDAATLSASRWVCLFTATSCQQTSLPLWLVSACSASSTRKSLSVRRLLQSRRQRVRRSELSA